VCAEAVAICRFESIAGIILSIIGEEKNKGIFWNNQESIWKISGKFLGNFWG